MGVAVMMRGHVWATKIRLKDGIDLDRLLQKLRGLLPRVDGIGFERALKEEEIFCERRIDRAQMEVLARFNAGALAEVRRVWAGTQVIVVAPMDVPRLAFTRGELVRFKRRGRFKHWTYDAVRALHPEMGLPMIGHGLTGDGLHVLEMDDDGVLKGYDLSDAVMLARAARNEVARREAIDDDVRRLWSEVRSVYSCSMPRNAHSACFNSSPSNLS